MGICRRKSENIQGAFRDWANYKAMVNQEREKDPHENHEEDILLVITMARCSTATSFN